MQPNAAGPFPNSGFGIGNGSWAAIFVQALNKAYIPQDSCFADNLNMGLVDSGFMFASKATQIKVEFVKTKPLNY